MLLSQPISELTTHVFLPVIEETVHRILRTLNLTDVIGDNIYIDTGFTSHSITSDIDKNAIVNTQGLHVEANIQMNPNSQKLDFYTFHHTTAYGIDINTFRNQCPIYYDRDNQIRIVEMRSPVSVMLNCELTLMSKELAYSTPQKIFNFYENGAVYELNDFAYDYPVPENILTILYGLWKIDRRKGAVAGKKFMEYLQMHTDNGWQKRKHRDKKEWEIVVPVYDLQTLGIFEYSDDKPNAEQENRLAIGFTIPFVYTLQFALPTLNILHYHPVYNNQILPERMIVHGTAKRFNNIAESRKGIDLQRYYERPQIGCSNYPGIIRSPEYDDWSVPAASPVLTYNQEPFFISCVTVDENDTLSTDLDYSGDFDSSFKIKSWIKELLYQQGEKSVEPNAILNVQVYRDNRRLIPYEDYTFTEDLHVKFKAVNLDSHYRVVFSECIQLSKIHPQWYPLLRKFYPFLNATLRSHIRTNIEHHGNWYDPAWGRNTKYIRVLANGWIVNDKNKPIIHISQSTYPKEMNYGNSSTYRITRYDIIARTTQDTETGSSK